MKALAVFAMLVAVASPRLRAQDGTCGEILQSPVEQRFVAERPGFEGVAVQLATYARRNECRLELTLRGADGAQIAHRVVDARTLVDAAFCALPCPSQGAAGGEYVLSLQSPDARSGGAVTVFCEPTATPAGLSLGGRERPGRMRMVFRYAGDHGAIGELVAGRRAVQTFAAPADGLTAVRVLLSDYARTNAGTLVAVLRDPFGGGEVARTQVDGAAVGNEHWLELRCAAIGGSRGRQFALELMSPDAAAGGAVTALLAQQATYDGQLSIDGELQLGRLTLAFDCEGGGLGAAAVARGGCALLVALGGLWALRRRGAPKERRSAVRFAAVGVFALVVVEGYLRDLWPLFYGGGIALGLAGVAFGLTRARRVRMLSVQAGVATVLLTLVLAVVELLGGGVPAAAAAAAPAVSAADGVELADAPWSFASAHGDPARFERWWQRLTGEWHRKDRGGGPLVEPDPLGELPFLVRANASSQFFESTIATNSLALRGPEVARQKGEAFRILCLGESTTMGQTLFATDVPWPERLQELVAQQGRARRIEVLNAGFAGYDLRHSVLRLKRFLLDLEPDLVVVYHGYNGFWMLLPDVPQALVASAQVPVRPERPSRLLAAAEHALAVRAFARAQFGGAPVAVADVDVEHSACAQAYRELIALCRARGAKVALCSFDMAVTRATPAEVVAFYRQGFPQVGRQVAANELQTALLRRLCDGGAATFVDAGADLDGRYQDRFVDLVHFTQAGRDQLAQNVLRGIEALLP